MVKKVYTPFPAFRKLRPSRFMMSCMVGERKSCNAERRCKY